MEITNAQMPKAVLKKFMDFEKLKHCFECGICTASCAMTKLLENEYNPRGLLEKIFLNPEKALASEELWFCAWCYRCYRRCPQAIKLPEIFLSIRKIAAQEGYNESFEKALQKIVEHVPLPLIAVLVCFHPERAGLDEKKILEKIELMRNSSLKKGKRKKASRNLKIAVIGSGPAGLTVAYELIQKGYSVTVFEALPQPGGMLRKCIPEYRLPRQALAKELQFITGLGVEIKTGITVGKDLSFKDLWKQGYKAIFVGMGAHESQKLKIPGGELKGVIHALDFLWNVNSNGKVEIGKNVVIIGGGNTAMDAAKVALKQGAAEATVLYRRSREEMPANPWEIEEAEDEGAKIEFLVAPKRILGENGMVTAIECVRMQLGEPDETGRRKPIPIEGTEFTKKTDMVILAIGETPNLTFLPSEVELNDDGTVWVNPTTMETSLRGVFAGGDAVRGLATVIEAIQDGKHAAMSIKNYFESLGG